MLIFMNDDVSLCEVTDENWRNVAELDVQNHQKDFVAEPSYYLCLCHYGGLWRPMAVLHHRRVIGFLMWAQDEKDGSCWIGGVMIDKEFQRKGYGTQAVRNAVEMLAEKHGFRHFALSYKPDNIGAKKTYRGLGFVETDEWEDDEIVARLKVEVRAD